MAPWIIGHFPSHRIYVEPFGGAAGVLLRKPRAYSEVYNDLNDEVVGLFRVLRNPLQAARLIELLRLTPYARSEFDAAWEDHTDEVLLEDDAVETARRMVVRSFQGFGARLFSTRHACGWRSCTTRSRTTPAHDWAGYPDALALVVERLQGVTICCDDARHVMTVNDTPETLHYVDPPYLHEARATGGDVYAHELTPRQHQGLLRSLRRLQGMVALSGYDSALYRKLLPGWAMVSHAAQASGQRGSVARTEYLWLNPALQERAGDLFGGAAAAAGA